jgi:uncharacterized repeat protein (TIGR03803 family)
MIRAMDGKYYGACSSGGANDWGTLFNYDLATNTFTKIFDFDTLSGIGPVGALVQAPSGIIYGTAPYGGSTLNGVIFSLDPVTSEFNVVYNFTGNNGATPISDLMVGNDGNLYGTSTNGGSSGHGVAYSFNPATGVYTALHNFDINTGYIPSGGFVAITSPEGIEDKSLITSMDVFPNPSSDIVSVTTTQKGGVILNYRITNILGQVFCQAVENSGATTITKELNISNLSQGVYYLEVTTPTGKGVKEFVKQ